MQTLRLAALIACFLLPLGATEVLAANAGVTAAVNQSARSTPPGGGVRTVVLGANVVQDEKIETDGAGLVQILLADGTTFTVGPNSSLTIDKFVYDPDANTAEVAASLGRGVFRFIGGRTSKTEGGVQLNTPVGTVGIRGGMADLNFTGSGGNVAQIDLLFGNEVTLGGPGGEHRVFNPGYSIIIGGNGQPQVVKTPPGSASFIQQALAGRPGTSGGSGQQPDDGDVAGSKVAENNSGSTPPPGTDIPPPDLDAIDLATPPVNDNHQVAEQVSGAEDTYGKRGFSAGLLVSDTQGVDVFPLALHDWKGKSRIKIDSSGNVLGGKTVVGIVLSSIVDEEEHEEGYDVDLSVTHGDYPGAPSMTASFNDQAYYSTAAITPSGISQPSTTPLCWDCTSVDWGTWYASFEGSVDGQPAIAKINGNWITGDIVSVEKYEQLVADYNTTKAYFSGGAAGYGQYYYADGSTSGAFQATGDAYVEWNFASRVGVFELTDFGGGPGNYKFSASTAITGENLARGFFSGDGGADGNFISASGAFVDGGEAVMGSFAGYGLAEDGDGDLVLDENEDPILFGASGVFAGDTYNPSN